MIGVLRGQETLDFSQGMLMKTGSAQLQVELRRLRAKPTALGVNRASHPGGVMQKIPLRIGPKNRHCSCNGFLLPSHKLNPCR